MNTNKYSKDELISIYKDFLKYPSKYKGSDMNDVTRTLSHKYNINPHKLKTECGDAVEHYKQPVEEKSDDGQNLIGKKFKSVSKVRAKAPGRGVDFIQVAGTVKDVKGHKVTIEDPLGHIYIINKNDFSRKNKFKNEIREVKWVKTKESIPVGTKVKITYGRHSGKMGIVSDDAATDGYSIVKVSGKKITIDDSDLLIKENIMKKTDLKQLIREEFKAYLNESNDGYVELIIMDPDFEKGWALIKQAWQEWKTGPATEPSMIRPAKQDLVKYLTQLANKEIK